MSDQSWEVVGFQGKFLQWAYQRPKVWAALQRLNPEIRFSAARVIGMGDFELLVPWEQVQEKLGVFIGAKQYFVDMERCFPETKEASRMPDYIFDVGANVGGFTVEARSLYPDAKIVAVEPNPVCFKFLRSNSGPLDVHCEEKAVGESGGRIEMAKGMSLTTASLGHSGVYKVKAGKRRYFARNERVWDETFEVECVGIEELMKGVEGSVLLKVDCEGGEYHIFTEKNRELLCKVDYLLMEAHPSEIGMPDDLMGTLEKWGFQSVREPMTNGCEMIYARGPGVSVS
ncbi:MAG: FkbM family methyltransferase [Verrucomicrobiales bacterium]|nr:FkbM family methyltransferase [Verrucomicrobiales bacterium]